MNVRLSARALREIDRIGAWWRKHRPAVRTLFFDELSAVLAFIETTPEQGRKYEAGTRRVVRRKLMKKSGNHAYYVRKSDELIVIVSVWGARRERGPRFR